MPKQNIRKVPQAILDRLQQFVQDDVIVACAKHLQPSDVPNYAHLGLSLDAGKLIVPPPSVPDPKRGRYSRANVEGYEKTRKDLPKYPKAIAGEAPNWRGYGTHTVWRTQMVYPREFYAPKEVELSVQVIEDRGSSYVVKFAIDQVINQRTKDFEKELLYNLNLLQESIGAADVFPAEASFSDYLKTIRVDWQILPAGTVDQVIAELKARRPITAEAEQVIRKRIAVIQTLRPQHYVAGTDGFLRYFGAQFGDDFVVFENIRYGNAIYVMYERWQELSKLSRVQLLAGPPDSFDRIVHSEGWEDRLKARVQAYRGRRKAVAR